MLNKFLCILFILSTGAFLFSCSIPAGNNPQMIPSTGAYQSPTANDSNPCAISPAPSKTEMTSDSISIMPIPQPSILAATPTQASVTQSPTQDSPTLIQDTNTPTPTSGNNTPNSQPANGNLSGGIIAFVSTISKSRDYGLNICIMNVDGSNITQLTHQSEQELAYPLNHDPAISPDGTRIIFSSKKEGYLWQLNIINIDGTNQKQLSSNPGNYYSQPGRLTAAK